jgi:hypothetical protein
MNSASDDDAQTAYLFQCGTEELFAVSLDRSGARLPRSPCTQGWILREEFQLGVQHPVPAAIAPEPILRGIRCAGPLHLARGERRSTQRNIPINSDLWPPATTAEAI